MNTKLSFDHIKDLRTYTGKTSNFLRTIAKQAFLVLIALILLAILYGEFLVFRYTYLLGLKPQETALTPITFKEELYKSVLQQIESRENTFNSVTQQNYQNPFK